MTRRLVALLCIAALVLTMVAPAVSGHFSDALAPLWVVLFPVLALVIVRRRPECCGEQPASLVSPLPSRAPPPLPALG